MPDRPASPAAVVRGLLRRVDRAALATRLAGGPPGKAGSPYSSLVLLAADHDATPLLLLSDLAQHSRNIAADARVALLVDGTGGLEDPLAGPRATLLGEAAKSADERQRGRFLARHPAAETYAGFADAHLYRVQVSDAHLVAGFGRIHWLAGEKIAFPAAPALALAEAELIARANADWGEALDGVAGLLGRPGRGWRLTGIDPEGIDLRRAGEVARLDFTAPVADAAAAEAELARLMRAARTPPRITPGRPPPDR